MALPTSSLRVRAVSASYAGIRAALSFPFLGEPLSLSQVRGAGSVLSGIVLIETRPWPSRWVSAVFNGAQNSSRRTHAMSGAPRSFLGRLHPEDFLGFVVHGEKALDPELLGRDVLRRSERRNRCEQG